MTARRRFESRRSGAPSLYGKRPIPRWDGGEDSSGRTYQPVWPKVWQACLDHGVTPRQLVEARFLLAGTVPPEPNTLTQPATVEAARRIAASEEANTKHLVATQLDRLRAQAVIACKVRPGSDPVLSALYGRDCEQYRPMSKYLFALMSNRGDLAEAFKMAAVAEFVGRRKAYESALAGILSPEFLALADQAYVAVRRPSGEGS